MHTYTYIYIYINLCVYLGSMKSYYVEDLSSKNYFTLINAFSLNYSRLTSWVLCLEHACLKNSHIALILSEFDCKKVLAEWLGLTQIAFSQVYLIMYSKKFKAKFRYTYNLLNIFYFVCNHSLTQLVSEQKISNFEVWWNEQPTGII